MFKIFEQHIIDILKDVNSHLGDGIDSLELVTCAFIKTFNELPRITSASKYDEEESNNIINLSDICSSIALYIDDNIFNCSVDIEKTVEEFKKAYPDCEILRIYENTPILYHKDFIILPHRSQILFHQNNIIPELYKYFIPKKKSIKYARVFYVSKGAYGFEMYPFNLNVKSIEGNYNNDLPIEKINTILNNEESGIILFNGVAGTGKSSFIRYLINQYKEDKEFLYLDSSVFYAMTDSSFIQFLLKHKNAVIILEDCEQILKSREGDSRNELISTILNISDGLLGDSLNLKFICTFNTDLTNIDKAILRKGRLKLKYEFKPLCKEKVAKIFEKREIDTKLAKEMTLAEIYNFEEDNGAKQERKKVGF